MNYKIYNPINLFDSLFKKYLNKFNFTTVIDNYVISITKNKIEIYDKKVYLEIFKYSKNCSIYSEYSETCCIYYGIRYHLVFNLDKELFIDLKNKLLKIKFLIDKAIQNIK